MCAALVGAWRIDVLGRGNLGNVRVILQMSVRDGPRPVHPVIAQPEVPGLVRILGASHAETPGQTRCSCPWSSHPPLPAVLPGRSSSDWCSRGRIFRAGCGPRSRRNPSSGRGHDRGPVCHFADDARVPAVLAEMLEPVGTPVGVADEIRIARGQMHARDAVLQLARPGRWRATGAHQAPV